MTPALEITTFELAGQATLADFVAANADVDAWLLQQPGFRNRWIAQRDDGLVSDVLLWASADAGRDAAQRLMSELADSPVHALIDQGTVSWTVSEVGHVLAHPHR